MSWFAIDDGWPFHRKTLAITDADAGLWAKLGCYCSGQLTDGFVPWEAIRKLSTSSGKELVNRVRRLVKAGFLSESSRNGVKGVRMHDFLDYNWSRERVRLLQAKRIGAGRKGGVRSGESRKQVLQAVASPLLQPRAGRLLEALSHPIPSHPMGSIRTPQAPLDRGAATGRKPRAGIIEVDPASSNGLGERERVRRLGYLLWENRYQAKYPQQPKDDDACAARVIEYHAAHVTEDLASWVPRVLNAYFGLDDPWLVSRKYAFRFLVGKLPQVLAAIGGA